MGARHPRNIPRGPLIHSNPDELKVRRRKTCTRHPLTPQNHPTSRTFNWGYAQSSVPALFAFSCKPHIQWRIASKTGQFTPFLPDPPCRQSKAHFHASSRPECNRFAQNARFQRYLDVVFCAGENLSPCDARLKRNPMHNSRFGNRKEMYRRGHDSFGARRRHQEAVLPCRCYRKGPRP